MFILLDEDNIVRCQASERCNIWARKNFADSEEPTIKEADLTGTKLGQMRLQLLEVDNFSGMIGDEYDTDTGQLTKHPENYPQPTAEETREYKIQKRMQEIARRQAEAELLAEGEI